MPQRGRAENDKGSTKKSSLSTQAEGPDQAGTTSKMPLEFRPVKPQQAPFDKKAGDRERDSLPMGPALSPLKEKNIQRRRAKSDQDITKSTNGENLRTPSRNTERPKSAGPPPDETVDKVTNPPRRKSLDTPSRPNTIDVLSKFYDAHVGDGNSYISDAADQWFKDLQSDTQALLEPYRKDRMKRVKIAILDTGVDRTHASIESQWSKRIKGVKSWVNSEGGDIDQCGHGTHAAALLLKVAPEAHVYVARIAKDNNSSINHNNVAQAIMHASDEWNVNIVTMSFGFPQRYLSIVNAVKHAFLKDIIIFAAASNDGARRKMAFPANLSSMVISINSADGGGARSRYNPPAQSTGDNFSVLGEAVLSAWPTKPGKAFEKRQWGTSTSTPIAAAIAALVLELVLELDKQPKESNIRISHRTTLQTAEGIREVFRRMSEAKDGYNFVVPWNVLSKRFSRERIADRLSDIMDDKFGAEFRCN
ncbi:hypothetical protein ACLMJK_002774 [Lecanora helva]